MLDKFYTKTNIAELCYTELMSILPTKTYTFLEPSAGCGRFIDILRKHNHNFIAYDILPEREDIIQKDFLNDSIEINEEVIVLGNPPFGKKSSLAVQFINKCFEYSKIVGFILPIQFRKYSAQNKIREDAILLRDITLPENSFTNGDKDYSLRCCFQIWCLPDFEEINTFQNLRTSKPITSHPDFEMFQYNCTKEALKFFDYDWDFCVYRQGFLDYSKKFYNKEELNIKNQYIFFKASNKRVLNNLLSLNFEELSKKNIRIPGFGKADIVEVYTSKYESLI